MKGRCFMCYKQEKQEKYAAKLQERFDELQVPFFYVGLTRARKELTLCYVRRQFEKERQPSRFLAEAGFLEEKSRY